MARGRRGEALVVEREEPGLDERRDAIRLQHGLEIEAEALAEPVPRDALGETKTHHQELVPLLLGREHGRILAAVSTGFDGLEPGLGRAVLARRDARGLQSEPAVGAGADADKVAVAPIDQIVPALGAWPRVVRDLISGETRGLEPRLRC